MIESEPFCADRAGKQDTIKETEYAAEKSGCSQKQGAENKGMVFEKDKAKVVHNSSRTIFVIHYADKMKIIPIFETENSCINPFFGVK